MQVSCTDMDVWMHTYVRTCTTYVEVRVDRCVDVCMYVCMCVRMYVQYVCGRAWIKKTMASDVCTCTYVCMLDFWW